MDSIRNLLSIFSSINKKSDSHIISSGDNLCLDTVSRVSDETDEEAKVDNSSEVNELKQENRTLHPNKTIFIQIDHEYKKRLHALRRSQRTRCLNHCGVKKLPEICCHRELLHVTNSRSQSHRTLGKLPVISETPESHEIAQNNYTIPV